MQVLKTTNSARLIVKARLIALAAYDWLVGDRTITFGKN